MTRVFDAPRAPGLRRLTKPELLKRWLRRPDGWSLRRLRDRPPGRRPLPLRVAAPETATRWAWAASIREIVPPERHRRHRDVRRGLVPGRGASTRSSLTRAGTADDVTTTVRYASKEARDAALQTPMDETAWPRASTALDERCWRRWRGRALSDPTMDRPRRWPGSSGAGRRRTRDGMARYGIVAPSAPSACRWATCSALGEAARARTTRSPLALWETGWYEARLLAALVDEPAARHAPRRWTRWARRLRQLGRSATRVCFHLFDRTPLAWEKARQWARVAARVREARGVRAAGVPGAARQDRSPTRASWPCCR